MEMAVTVVIQLDRPLCSAAVGGDSAQVEAGQPAAAETARGVELERENLAQAIEALSQAAKSLREAQESISKGHKEVVAKLAVEIARRILARQVEKGDYKIEAIVAQAVGGVGNGEDIVVHLNPDDIEACRKAFKQDGIGEGVKLSADPQVGRAECSVEWHKGVIQSAIEQQLERVSEALMKA